MGIEPTSEAWEASILPLYDARLVTKLTKASRACKHTVRPRLHNNPSSRLFVGLCATRRVMRLTIMPRQATFVS
jgi:hypothetical protein